MSNTTSHRAAGIPVVMLIFLFVLGAGLDTYAQIGKRKTRRIRNLEGTIDTLNIYAASDIFDFPNINRISYYQSKPARDAITKYENEKNWEKLYKILRPYVRNFGIKNFYRDTYLIWRLAKLTELYGEMEEAKLLYKLVLRHHQTDQDIKKVELYFDSLTKNDQDYYVPLDYYYELVEYRKEIDTLRPPRGVLLNMGSTVNSDRSDYGPALNITNDVLIFTSKRNVMERGLDKIENEDLFSSKSEEGYWLEAQPYDELNTIYNEGSACLSKDGTTMYFARCYAPDGQGNCDLYVTYLQGDGKWGVPENLGQTVNSNAWDSHPSLSHTGDTLYFASDRIGGFGLSDIYFTYKDSNGNWKRPKNAGPIINTRNNEVSPFYHPMYDILYFSSNGQLLNFGEFDIYKAYYSSNSWGEPQNIGPLVNGEGNEFYFTIDSESRYLFYSRSKDKGLQNMDLFSFPLPMEAQPTATTRVYGSLKDSFTGDPFKGIVSIIDLDNGIEVAPKFLRPDGSFEFKLINNNNYLLIIQGDEFFRIEEIFYLDGEMEMHRTTESISSKLKFTTIEFENGKADLLPEMYADMDKVANFLIDNPDFKVRISGHTDSDGSATLNQQLSQARADAIREYIIHLAGVEEDRVEAIGYGSSKPIVEEKTDEDKKLNRRVEFEIYRPPAEALDLNE